MSEQIATFCEGSPRGRDEESMSPSKRSRITSSGRHSTRELSPTKALVGAVQLAQLTQELSETRAHLAAVVAIGELHKKEAEEAKKERDALQYKILYHEARIKTKEEQRKQAERDASEANAMLREAEQTVVQARLEKQRLEKESEDRIKQEIIKGQTALSNEDMATTSNTAAEARRLIMESREREDKDMKTTNDRVERASEHTRRAVSHAENLIKEQHEKVSSDQQIAIATLHVPEDVAWFVPDAIGWLCDYAFVQSQNGERALKILPRNTGLGKIMVYNKTKSFFGVGRHATFRIDKRYGHVNDFYAKAREHYFQGRRQFIGDWMVVAVDYYWNLDRMFAISAKFGDSTAVVRLASSFKIGQEIPLKKAGSLTLSDVRFPGLIGTDEVVHAYE